MQRDEGSFEEMDESVAEQAERRAKVIFITTVHLYRVTQKKCIIRILTTNLF